MMKVLIVEGNIVMMEIISDVLSVDGFIVATATNAKDADVKYNSFTPDVVVYDVDTKDANVLNFISQINPDDNVRIIAVCNSRADVPAHTKITACIVKPFKGSEILMAVRKAKNDLETRNKKMKKFGGFFSGLFGGKKKENKTDATENNVLRKNLKPLKSSYLVIEPFPKKVYDIGKEYTSTDSKIFILTTSKIRQVKAMFPETNVMVTGMAKKAKEGYFSYAKIGSIMGELGTFTKNNVNGIVIVEGTEELIELHGMSTVVTMMCQLVDNGAETGTVFLFSVKPETFSENEKNLLLHHLEVYGEKANEENTEEKK